MNVKTMSLCLTAGWAGLQTLVAVAATAAATVATDADARIDTRMNLAGLSIGSASLAFAQASVNLGRDSAVKTLGFVSKKA